MEDIQQAIGLGAVTYLVKANYSLNEVVGVIERITSGQPNV
jgi:hypothetical protein